MFQDRAMPPHVPWQHDRAKIKNVVHDFLALTKGQCALDLIALAVSRDSFSEYTLLSFFIQLRY